MRSGGGGELDKEFSGLLIRPWESYSRARLLRVVCVCLGERRVCSASPRLLSAPLPLAQHSEIVQARGCARVLLAHLFLGRLPALYCHMYRFSGFVATLHHVRTSEIVLCFQCTLLCQSFRANNKQHLCIVEVSLFLVQDREIAAGAERSRGGG